MATSGAKSAAVCKRILPQSPQRRLNAHVLPRACSSQRSRPQDARASSAHPMPVDEFIARGRDECSGTCDLFRQGQGRADANISEARFSMRSALGNSWGSFSGSSSNLRRFSSSRDFLELSNTPPGSVIAVGMSGGVDSSMAALLLKRQGYEVFGMFMRNWDARDEAGDTACSADEDYQDALKVCNQLGIELREVDYQRRYWINVFESFTRDCAVGLTPNPDLACNEHIKFGALLENARELGADRLATGHYARLFHPPGGKPVQLLRGVDPEKDQSYFLASVKGNALERVVFPLGSLHKSNVRSMAISESLTTASRRSSAGVCFVGRRNFADFLSDYIDMPCGPFIAVEDGSKVGTHDGIAAYTFGQRARIGGQAEAAFVVGKDVANNTVVVASGPDHPALFTRSAVADSLSWIAGEMPPALAEGRVLKCLYKARYRQCVEECTVCLVSAHSGEAVAQGLGVAGRNSGEFVPSSFCRLQTAPLCRHQLQVRFTKPARAITPGQALVLYDGDVCLGAARLLYPGPTLFEYGRDTADRAVVKVSSICVLNGEM